ncbi:uncharacterized protein [Ptychodera flava]|uniref:uncharacterized protein n=1 Tax=Ptychodera flava TaxID=63121 RepID=UPI00396A4902
MAHSLNRADMNHGIHDVSDGEQVEEEIDVITPDIGEDDLQDDFDEQLRSESRSPELNHDEVGSSRLQNANVTNGEPSHVCNGHDERLANGMDLPDEGIEEMEDGAGEAVGDNFNYMNDFVEDDIEITETNSDFNNIEDDVNFRPGTWGSFERETGRPNSNGLVNGHLHGNDVDDFIDNDEDYTDGHLDLGRYLNHVDRSERQRRRRWRVALINGAECREGRNCLSLCRQSSRRCHHNPSGGEDGGESNYVNEHRDRRNPFNDQLWDDREEDENEENLEGAVGGCEVINDDSNHSNSNVDADDEREREEPTEEDKLAAEIINFGLMSFRGGRYKVKDILKKVARSKYSNMIDFNKLIEDIHLYEQRYRAHEARDRDQDSSGSNNDDQGVENDDSDSLDKDDDDDDIGCQDEANNTEMRLNYKRPDDHNNFDYLSMISEYDNPISFEDSEDECDHVDKPVTPMKADDDTVFLWTFEEAVARQVRQIGASACGATAVINVLNCLYMCPDIKIVADMIPTRLRANHSPLPEYLFSRSVAGTTHEDLIQSVSELTEGKVYGRFFPFYPKRNVDLKEWLAYWMRKGVVPMATLNLQRGQEPGWKIPDAWHHQMVHGLGADGIYMTNPLVTESVERLNQQLCSDSVLLIRKYDVLGRWNEETDLTPLMTHPDKRWAEMNVLGQVVNMIRERTPPAMDYPGFGQQSYRLMTTHIKIPAAYKSGITMFVKVSKEDVYNELHSAPDLPVLEQSGEIRNICVASGRVCRKL